ncbi:MAG: ABC transporter permease [Pirellulales bacterium]|nr:ABC transporter permease [Pirellulales bacterium]
MRIVLQLVLANLRQHPGRFALTSLAIIAAACVVIWVTSGYDALLAQFDQFADQYLGRYQLVLVSDAPNRPTGPGAPSGPPLPPELIPLLQQDPAVATLDPLAQSRLTRVTRVGSPGRSFRSRPTLVGTGAKQPPHEMVQGTWIDPARPERAEGVLSAEAARQIEAGVGDEVVVESEAGEFRLSIAGIVHQASMPGDGPRRSAPSRGPATSALYVPVALAEKISGRPAKISCINIALQEGVDAESFRRRWNARLKQEGFPAAVFDPGDVKDDMAQGLSAARVRNQAYSATGVSLLAALFIILTTLSMGVHERVRQFAILRAVALTRFQVACMIALESLVLATVGWFGGLAAGWGLLWIVAKTQRDDLSGGASLGVWAVVLSAVCAFGGALAASVLPAWQVARVRPLEAMASRPTARPVRWSAVAAVVGLVLIAVNPLLVFVMPMPDETRYGVYAALGCTSMAMGFMLLAPAAILATEKAFGPLVAGILRLDRRLLSTQLSSNLWRTVGTTVALSLGLGLFAAMQTWGHSMLRPFVPGDWAPDVLVCFTSGGLPEQEIDSVARLRGVVPERCLPLAVEQPKLAEDITGSRQRASVARQDNVIIIGLDPQVGLGGSDPLLKPDFVEGNRRDAVERLKQGRGCLVPDHFARATGLGLGDRFALLPPGAPEQRVEYTIAGVVSLPGWHWMTKFSGLRRRSGRTAAMVLASREDVRRDFGLERTNFLWLDTRKGANLEDMGAALQAVAARHPGRRQPVNAQGTWTQAARMFGPAVRVTTAEDVRSRIHARASSMIWGMCRLPLVTLIVTSLGVVHAVLASIRTRGWEMGVLRATGHTRFGLVRLVLAEALLIGLVACLLSLGFGIMAGWCGMGVSQYVSFFGGLNPSLVVPWSKLAIGLAGTLGLCLLAALWPAIATGFAEPLRLLQAGRSAR